MLLCVKSSGKAGEVLLQECRLGILLYGFALCIGRHGHRAGRIQRSQQNHVHAQGVVVFKGDGFCIQGDDPGAVRLEEGELLVDRRIA